MPIPTEAEFLQRVDGLLPALRARRDGTNENRKIDSDTIRDFHEAGIFRILQPKRWGGYEMHPRVFFETLIRISSACPSTGWVLGVVGVHQWQIALFPDEAQREVWGDDARTIASSSYMPVAKVQVVDGGYRVSGRWGFSSGSEHCQWALLGGFVPTAPDVRVPDMRTFLIPRSDYRLEDTWHTAGLEGTGSCDLVIDDCFVPEHRTHKFADGFRCKNPGNAVNDAPVYHLPFGQIFVRSVSTGAIGMLQGAIEQFQATIAERVSRADGQKGTEDPKAQLALANAICTLEEVKLVLFRNLSELMDAAEQGGGLSVERRVQFRYESARAVAKSKAAVDQMIEASGSGWFFRENPLQRFFRDIHAAGAHYANQVEKPGQNMGRVLSGQSTTDYFI